MSTHDGDFSFLSEALPQLQDYLLSNELYWPLGASQPRLTPGALLLALARLRIKLPAEAQKMQEQLDGVRLKWRSAWMKKVAREISNRILLWSNYLSDYENDPRQAADDYPSEVRGRVILQLLLFEALDLPETGALVDLDSILKAGLHPCEFIWDAGLQVVFPKLDYWFLYGKL